MLSFVGHRRHRPHRNSVPFPVPSAFPSPQRSPSAASAVYILSLEKARLHRWLFDRRRWRPASGPSRFCSFFLSAGAPHRATSVAGSPSSQPLRGALHSLVTVHLGCLQFLGVPAQGRDVHACPLLTCGIMCSAVTFPAAGNGLPRVPTSPPGPLPHLLPASGQTRRGTCLVALRGLSSARMLSALVHELEPEFAPEAEKTEPQELCALCAPSAPGEAAGRPR